MEKEQLQTLVSKLLAAIQELIPGYMQNQVERDIAGGNLAVCLIDEEGTLYGRMYGTDKPRMRRSFKIAWTKASQVWLTGVATGEYEKMVFNGLVDENANGIEAPDLIGWQGGQPLRLPDGSTLSVGFSGFRGVVDVEIMVKALDIALAG